MSNAFETALKNMFNNEVAISENGATMFATSGKKLLDINFAISSLRNKPADEIEKMFSAAFYESPMLAVKWMFMLRDVRSGAGERRSFRICMKWLAGARPGIAQRLIKLTSEYGRWDDLFCLVNPDKVTRDVDIVEDEVIKVIHDQWASDIKNMSKGKAISLLAKWMPSITTSSPKTVALAKFFAKQLELPEKQYRKTLSAMRKHLDVIERKMSAKQWNEINYETVPSQANIKYKNAFMRNDNERRSEYLNKLATGEAKINATTNFPSDIVHAYSSNVYYRRRVGEEDATLEAMWKALPNVAVNGNVIAVADGSGSMTTKVGNGQMSALEVCNALAIYCAEHCTGPFKDKYITFSDRPQYVDMSNAKTLREKLMIAYNHDECANTNIEATFDLVLKTAVDNNLKQEDIPTLVILSDMEFDAGSDFGDGSECWNSRPTNYSAIRTALMEQIRQRWQSAGYKLPRVIWWNIASRTGVVPMQQNELGVILCSGYSQSQFKMLASNKTDPYEVLVESLNTERYQPIEDAIKDII